MSTHTTALICVTCSGTESRIAKNGGTPISLAARYGSGEMTDRAAKFTRLPIIFLRKRPSFFSSDCRMPYHEPETIMTMMVLCAKTQQVSVANAQQALRIIAMTSRPSCKVRHAERSTEQCLQRGTGLFEEKALSFTWEAGFSEVVESISPFTAAWSCRHKRKQRKSSA